MKHLTNTQLATALKNIIRFENRTGEKLFDIARAAKCSMTNYAMSDERHPAVIRWSQALGRGCSLRLEAQVRLQRQQVIASTDHAMIEALMRLPTRVDPVEMVVFINAAERLPADVQRQVIERCVSPAALLDYAEPDTEREIAEAREWDELAELGLL